MDAAVPCACLFNYPWVAEVHLEHYRVTGRRQSLLDAYETMLKSYEKPVPYAFVESPECEIVVRLREAGLGPQPSWHSHDIGMHHWDGYWFGKRRRWGDTLPHDWNGTAADVFRALAEATGDKSYLVRARAVVRQLLGLFDADGRAGCAWVLPDRVNGEPARFRDPLANDQDWSLVYYLRHFGRL